MSEPKPQEPLWPYEILCLGCGLWVDVNPAGPSVCMHLSIPGLAGSECTFANRSFSVEDGILWFDDAGYEANKRLRKRGEK